MAPAQRSVSCERALATWPRIWYTSSPDGSWGSATVPSTTPEDIQTIEDVVWDATNNRFLATGWVFQESSEGTDALLKILSSPDGETWTVAYEETFTGAAEGMTARFPTMTCIVGVEPVAPPVTDNVFVMTAGVLGDPGEGDALAGYDNSSPFGSIDGPVRTTESRVVTVFQMQFSFVDEDAFPSVLVLELSVGLSGLIEQDDFTSVSFTDRFGTPRTFLTADAFFESTSVVGRWQWDLSDAENLMFADGATYTVTLN